MMPYVQTMYDALTWLFGHICHQDPARTWYCGSMPLFVCQRCSGMYTGFVLGFVFSRIRRLRFQLTPLTLSMHVAMIGIALLFFVKWLPDTALTRAVSGLLFGLGITYFLFLPGRSRTPEIIGKITGPRMILHHSGEAKG